MRILLDENIPLDLATELAGFDVDTVVGQGWSGLANGKLLDHASGKYSALITMDRNIAHQQNISVLPFGVLVLRARSNRLADLLPLIPEILDGLSNLQPGQLRYIGA